jgi:hypothetical protein
MLLLISARVRRYLAQNNDNLEEGAYPHKRLEPHLRIQVDSSTVNADMSNLAYLGSVALMQPRSTDNLYDLGLQLRVFKRYLMEDLRTGTVASPLYAHLRNRLFPWIPLPTPIVRFRGHTGQGIVLTTGDAYFRFAVHLVRTIRFVYNATLPIEIFYIGPRDLNRQNRKFLDQMSGVRTRDLSKIFDTRLLDLHGWDAKPFAMLACSFSHALLVDADTVLMQDPGTFFGDADYNATGALFFHDRTLFPTDRGKQQWLENMLPKPLSQKLTSRRFFQMKTSYEQEAGVVVIDKSRHLPGLMAACALNMKAEREGVIHRETHGEKETFWLGFELVQDDYIFNAAMPGTVGRIEADHDVKGRQLLCGKLAHFDRRQRLWWFNDSIANSKKDAEWAKETSDPTHAAIEGKWNPYLCLYDAVFQPLRADERQHLERLRRVYVFDPLKDKFDGTFQNDSHQ